MILMGGWMSSSPASTVCGPSHLSLIGNCASRALLISHTVPHTLLLLPRRRTRTLYLPWGFVPMMPRSIATGAASLRRGEVGEWPSEGASSAESAVFLLLNCIDPPSPPQTGCAISVGVRLAADGSIAEYEVVSSTIRVTDKVEVAVFSPL